MQNYADILFVDEVLELQIKDGSAEQFKKHYPNRTKEKFDHSELDFIADRESFYIASISSSGWPYVQHRGGQKGFLKVLDNSKLVFADYPGNRQFLTIGHSAKDSRVALFLMDYERSARLKILGHLSMQAAADSDPELLQQVAMSNQAKIERVATIEVVAIDWNCPKYIPQMFSAEKVKYFMQSQLSHLSAENKALKAQLAELQQK